jgi:hypothetical protein
MRSKTMKAILAAAAITLVAPSPAMAQPEDDRESSRDNRDDRDDRDDRGRGRDRDREDGGFPWGLLGLLGLGGLAGLMPLRRKAPDLHVDARHNPPPPPGF